MGPVVTNCERSSAAAGASDCNGDDVFVVMLSLTGGPPADRCQVAINRPLVRSLSTVLGADTRIPDPCLQL